MRLHRHPKGLTGKPALAVRQIRSSHSEFNDLKNSTTSKLFFSVLMKLLSVIKCYVAVKHNGLFTDLLSPKDQNGLEN